MTTGKTIAGFVCGLLFAIGLGISGMAQPSKVLGFLDLFGGAWDPSLAFVMVGGIAVGVLVRRVAPTRPLFDPAYPALRRTGIDRRLVGGALLFGVGWGLVGYCPGPAVLSVGAFVPGSVLFVAAMIMGMAAFEVSDL